MEDQLEEKHIRQTIGFRVAEAQKKEKDLAFIVEDVLQEVCKVSVGDILCMQDLPAQGIYDVTFYNEPVCARAMEKLKAAADGEVLRGIDFCPGCVSREVTITVEMYNLFCSEEAVAAFLHIYCDEVGEGVKLYNRYDIWNGQRRFVVTLESDDDGIGGTRHPPAVFNIGLDIGFLYYPGQPKFCSTCSTFGHFSPDCPKYERDSDDDIVGRYPTRLQVEENWRSYAEKYVQEDVALDHPDLEDLGANKVNGGAA